MKNWIITLIIVSLSVLLYFAFRSDDNDLGDNYHYLPDYEAIDVGYPGGAIIYKSAQKLAFDDVKISGNVKDVSWNKDFILAYQKLGTSYNNTNHFFIIVKKTDLVYGPFQKDEYLRWKHQLGVPEELNLKE